MKDPQQNPTWIEEIIITGQEDGEFENLPGAGKPIPGAGKPDDELWWFRSWLERNGEPNKDDTQ